MRTHTRLNTLWNTGKAWVHPQEVQSHLTLHSVSRARFTLLYITTAETTIVTTHTHSLISCVPVLPIVWISWQVAQWSLNGKKELVWLARIATYRPFFFFCSTLGSPSRSWSILKRRWPKSLVFYFSHLRWFCCFEKDVLEQKRNGS